MEYYAIFDGVELKNVVEIEPTKPHELLRLLEVCSMLYDQMQCKVIDLETYEILKGAFINESN
jgi:hypothetical protein